MTRDVRVALRLFVCLVVGGALLGLVWSWWSGPQQRAYVVGPGKLYPFDEVETMAAADGRYLTIVAAVGIVAAVVAWWFQAHSRGAAVAAALGTGGLAGAALTAWVGHLAGGGTSSGRTDSVIAHLPLSVHMTGLLFVEPALALLLYGVLVAFAVRDDLGRPDPVRDRLLAEAGSESDSVGPEGELQDARGDRDRAGALQQGEFPAQ